MAVRTFGSAESTSLATRVIPRQLPAIRVREAGLVAAVLVTVLALAAVPVVYGYVTAPAGTRFMGVVLNVPDTAQYFSWARESAHALLIQNKLTPEHGDAVYFNLFWFVVGRLATALSIGVAEATHIIQPLAGAVYVLAIYWFTGRMFSDRPRHWTSTLIAVLGGGLGWLLVLQKQLAGTAEIAFPLDVYTTEANTFLSIMAFPHQAVAGGVLVAILGLAALAFERRSLRLACAAGVLGLVLGLQHGYDLLIVYAVVGSMAVARAVLGGSKLTELGLAAVMCGWSVPAAAYSVYLTRASPIWRSTLAQYGNAGVYTPTPPHLLVLMGLPLIFTLAGLLPVLWKPRWPVLRASLRSTPARELLLWTWLVVGFCLLYIPTDFQIKMLVGWQVPLSVFATRAVFGLADQAARYFEGARSGLVVPILVGLFVGAVLPTNAYLLGWRLVDLGRHDYPYYLHADEVAALEWLQDHSAPSDVVLSSITVGQYLPSISGNNAFLAHWAETVDYYNKRGLVSAFFTPSSADEKRADMLDTYQVRYVFYGPAERVLGSYNPDGASYLQKAYSNASVSVYEVTLPKALRTARHDL